MERMIKKITYWYLQYLILFKIDLSLEINIIDYINFYLLYYYVDN